MTKHAKKSQQRTNKPTSIRARNIRKVEEYLHAKSEGLEKSQKPTTQIPWYSKTRLRGKASPGRVGLAILLTIVFLYLILASLWSAWQTWQLKQVGIVTNGTVVTRAICSSQTRGGRSTLSYIPIVEYHDTKGDEHTVEMPCGTSTPSSIRLYYLPGDPTVMAFADQVDSEIIRQTVKTAIVSLIFVIVARIFVVPTFLAWLMRYRHSS